LIRPFSAFRASGLFRISRFEFRISPSDQG